MREETPGVGEEHLTRLPLCQDAHQSSTPGAVTGVLVSFLPTIAALDTNLVDSTLHTDSDRLGRMVVSDSTSKESTSHLHRVKPSSWQIAKARRWSHWHPSHTLADPVLESTSHHHPDPNTMNFGGGLPCQAGWSNRLAASQAATKQTLPMPPPFPIITSLPPSRQ